MPNKYDAHNGTCTGVYLVSCLQLLFKQLGDFLNDSKCTENGTYDIYDEEFVNHTCLSLTHILCITDKHRE